MDHEEIIKKLNLREHPEGGYYRETYRSKGIIAKEAIGEEFTGARNYSTCIYFLLTREKFSAFHRIKQDELWHFYKGDPLSIHIIDSAGNYREVIIGSMLEKGVEPQAMVPAGSWFASCVRKGGEYTLAGCTVAPGFDFDDFELAEKYKLIKAYPHHELIINKYTR